MKNYEEPQETIVYGGAFNPPTRAHQAILQACIDYAEPRGADVWIMPSGDRTDKEINTPHELRLAYIEALATDVMARTVQIDIETTELYRGYQTETCDTVSEMAAMYPGRKFTWVFGSDSVNSMHKWQGGEAMLRELSMLIVERPGYAVRKLGVNAVKLDVATGEISSSLVRQRLSVGEQVSDLVSPKVAALLL